MPCGSSLAGSSTRRSNDRPRRMGRPGGGRSAHRPRARAAPYRGRAGATSRRHLQCRASSSASQRRPAGRGGAGGVGTVLHPVPACSCVRAPVATALVRHSSTGRNCGRTGSRRRARRAGSASRAEEEPRLKSCRTRGRHQTRSGLRKDDIDGEVCMSNQSTCCSWIEHTRPPPRHCVPLKHLVLQTDGGHE